MTKKRDTYLKDMPHWTGGTIGTLLAEDLKLKKRILEEQGECITYNLKDVENLKQV